MLDLEEAVETGLRRAHHVANGQSATPSHFEKVSDDHVVVLLARRAHNHHRDGAKSWLGSPDAQKFVTTHSRHQEVEKHHVEASLLDEVAGEGEATLSVRGDLDPATWREGTDHSPEQLRHGRVVVNDGDPARSPTQATEQRA